MGDKTQLIAVMLAAKSGFAPVFAGVVSATILLQLIAVSAGVVLGELINNRTMLLLISAAVFAYFGIRTIIDRKEEGRVVEKSTYPGITAFTVFFAAELGDKTQIATMTRAATSTAPLFTFAGAVCGMVAANAIGMLIGSYLKKRFTDTRINVAAGLVFIAFAAAAALGAIKSIL